MKLSIWNSFVAHETKSNQTTAVNETWARTKKPGHNNTPLKGIFHSHDENVSFSRVIMNTQYYQSFCNISYACS